MAKPSFIEVPRSARKQIKKAAMGACISAAERIAKACNEESSWGFYEAFEGHDKAFVVGLVHKNSSANERAARILRNIHRGDV